MSTLKGAADLAAWIKQRARGTIDDNIIDQLVEAVYRVSLESDEGRWPAFKMFVPLRGQSPRINVPLSLPLEARTLRRLWSVADPEARMLLVDVTSTATVVGLMDVD